MKKLIYSTQALCSFQSMVFERYVVYSDKADFWFSKDNRCLSIAVRAKAYQNELSPLVSSKIIWTGRYRLS